MAWRHSKLPHLTAGAPALGPSGTQWDALLIAPLASLFHSQEILMLLNSDHEAWPRGGFMPGMQQWALSILLSYKKVVTLSENSTLGLTVG